MHQVFHIALWYSVLLATLVYAWWKGGLEERVVSSTILSASLVISLFFFHTMHGRDAVAVVGVSVLGTLVCVYLAMVTSKWWPMFAAAFQLVATGALVVVAIDPSLRLVAAYVNSEAWDYFTLGAVVLGTRYEARPLSVGVAVGS